MPALRFGMARRMAAPRRLSFVLFVPFVVLPR
jgi:hypothetical protein